MTKIILVKRNLEQLTTERKKLYYSANIGNTKPSVECTNGEKTNKREIYNKCKDRGSSSFATKQFKKPKNAGGIKRKNQTAEESNRKEIKRNQNIKQNLRQKPTNTECNPEELH